MTSAAPAPAPNHHADHPAFAGLSGLVAALSMTVGHGATARFIADLAGVTEADRVVDLGCGPGTAAREAARRGADVIGVDPAPVMLRVARRIPGRGHRVWMLGSAEDLAVPSASQTVVWALSTVHHWDGVDAAVAECFRVLEPSGRFIAAERKVSAGAEGLASHGWTAAQAEAFAEHCRTAGFAVEVSAPVVGSGSLLVVQAIKP